MSAKTSLAIDIGSRMIKVLQLAASGSNYTVQEALTVDIDPSADNETRRENVTQALRDLLANHKLDLSNVVFGLTGTEAILRFVSMPFMSAEELRESMEWEARNHLPSDPSDMQIDTHILNEYEEIEKSVGEKPEDDEEKPGDIKREAAPTAPTAPVADEENAPQKARKINTLLVAARKDLINTWLETFRHAGITPMVIDIAACALLNVHEYLTKDKFEFHEVEAVIDIGYSASTVIILKKGTLVFARDVNSGGRNVLEEIADGGDVAEVERSFIQGDVDQAKAKSAMGTLCQEIQRTFMYAERSGAIDGEINAVSIYGGWGGMPGLSEAVTSQLGVQPQLISPFSGLEMPGKIKKMPDNMARLFTMSVGLGLRGLDIS